jgi:hypothetical protein
VSADDDGATGSGPERPTATADAVRDALERLAAGIVETVTIWVRGSTRRLQLSRVRGEPAVLCELATDEFLAPSDRLGAAQLAALDELGFPVAAGTTATAWLSEATGSGRAEAVATVAATLEALGQDLDQPPAVVDGG